jgi:hypothetical protein
MLDRHTLTRRVFWLSFVSVSLAAQTPSQQGLSPLTRELRTAIQNDSLAAASELADKLDGAVQQRYKHWLIRDAGQRVKEVLAWLPGDTESLWVNQEPFVITPAETAEMLYERPAQLYSVDRLMALDGGKFYRALGNHTVRLVVAAARQIRAAGENISVPGRIAAQDLAYFYFFADTVDLPEPDESFEGRPVWHATQPDENWITLAQSDLLILSNRRELLADVLRRITGGGSSRALPPDLPEWSQVTRSASFWGLRHYTALSKPKQGDSGFDQAELPRPDGAATGVVMRFDSVSRRLEIRYLSDAQVVQHRGAAAALLRDFQVDQTQPGVWRLVSDTEERGSWPVHFALTMLGFGMYR